ncbi:uncharacterized protein LOC122529741 [Frieseomelitta varia]|uniref:uncharacterized protein LOC122529741 n=1 Tax=Frieseomelitta varia TaxID=561572 RepID=UPI001CB69FD2|nr:uncharacterized protein LOC122529741 [Frieseomelitta varia]
MPFIKILVLLAHKEDFFRLILYLQRKFLHSDYDSYERQIVIGFKRKCTFFIYFLTFFTLATVASYIVNPLIANIGKNESDRVLPFNMWVDLPLTTTPYYEITFVIQVLSLYHIGISYFCFDNFLCIINLHVAGQFQILQYRITNMPDLMNKGKQRRNEVSYKESTCFADEYYTIFKKYIRQHQTLIAYCEKLEEVFNWIILEQVLMFSLLICLDGYQVLLAGAPTRTRLIFSFHIGACLCQLLMFTYSCDCIIRESMSVAIAAYKAPWPLLSMTASGRMMQKDLTLVIMRSSVPCCLTGRGFFIVSLETYTNISSYIVCNLLGLFTVFFKIVTIFIYREKFFRLIVHMQENFWHFSYDQYENSVLANTKRMCIYFVCVFSIFSQFTVFSYIMRPIISNIGKNKSERILIFDMHLDLPLSISPYYEIMYLIQTLALYQNGVCYLCIDDIFCIMCLHVAGQFRILQYRMENVLSPKDKDKLDQYANEDASIKCYAIFKNCIQQHQILIEFYTTLEEIFTIILLGQVLTFSILICFIGYQAFLVELPLSWRISLVLYLTSNIWQLWIFTYSCDFMAQESMNIANAAYIASWIYLPMDRFGKMIRKGLQFVIMRSRRPCYLTACGFFPISLETFTKIMSSAMSYFTILKQRTVDRAWASLDNVEENSEGVAHKTYYHRYAVTFRCQLVRNPIKRRTRTSQRFIKIQQHILKCNMSTKHHKDISFRLTTFFLKVVGLWLRTTRVEKWLRNAVVVYTILTIIFFAWIYSRGLYFFWGDFSISSYMVCNLLGMFLVFLKIVTVFIYKEKFFRLIVHMQENFWHFNYDQYENSILADTKRMCIYFVCVFSIFSQFTAFSYIINPVISNIGRNATERILIFDMHLDLPLSTSPYYEIMYLIQALAVYQNDVCYLCIDDIFCIMCLHAASQFRILQYRIANVPSLKIKDKLDQYANEDASIKCYAIFKNCIQQHQTLIEFSTTLEEIFTIIVLGQVLTFSILICFVGYLTLLVELTLSSRISLICFLSTNISQLWIFTYSCDFMAQESMNVANAVYTAPWIYLPMDRFGKMIRQDLQIVMMRSRRACYLTACGFFPISLETFTKIMSSAMSYFTILKQQTADTAG